MEIAGPLFIRNNKIIQHQEFNSNFLRKGVNIYEVIRVINGIPLFFEDHYQRFKDSLELSLDEGKKIPDQTDVLDTIYTLIRHGHIQQGNIKIVYHISEKENFLISYPIKSNYPNDLQYSNGVKTAIYKVERIDPGIKNWPSQFKKNAARLKKEKNVYELILIRHDGVITEGSQSNIFFIKKDSVYTAPEKIILPGITRKYVFQICLSRNIPIIEREFDLNFIKESDAAFLSGTSPKILPVSHINQMVLETNHDILDTIRSAYQEIINNYIQK
jgi:branched-chain amino acid aminotransferase